MGGFAESGRENRISAESGPLYEYGYSKAWKMLRVAEKEWGFLLTDRETGGRDGGGSTLTPQAKELMEAYLSFRRDAEAELDRLFETYFSDEWLNHMREMGGNEKNE